MNSIFSFFKEKPELFEFFSKGILVTFFILNFVFTLIFIVAIIEPDKYHDENEPVLTNPIKGADFHIFHLASTLAAQEKYNTLYSADKLKIERAKLYDELPDGIMSFSYPPPALVLFAPLSRFDYDTSLFLWLSVSILSILGATYALTKNWIITLLACVTPFVLWGGVTGQTGLISAAILVAGYLARERDKPFLSGLIFGCLIFKPHLALALPFCFIATKEWKVIIGGITSVAFMIVLSYVLFGAEAWAEFFANFGNNSSFTLQEKTSVYERIPTIFITIFGLFDNLTLATSLHAIGALLAIVTCVYIWRNSEDMIAKLTCLFITPALISPYFFDYDLSSVGIIFGLLLLEIMRKKQLDWHFLALLGVWGMGLSILLSKLNGLSLGPVFLIGLMAYAVLRVRTENKKQPSL